jgi:hypothetical protein
MSQTLRETGVVLGFALSEVLTAGSALMGAWRSGGGGDEEEEEEEERRV